MKYICWLTHEMRLRRIMSLYIIACTHARTHTHTDTHTNKHAGSRFYLSSVTGSFYSCLASLSLITQESSLFAIQLCKMFQTTCCCTNSMRGQVYLLKSYLYYVFNLFIYRKGEFRDVNRGELANKKLFFQQKCFRGIFKYSMILGFFKNNHGAQVKLV